jgi:hypothetical protein
MALYALKFRLIILWAEAWRGRSVWHFIRNHFITSVGMVLGAFISVGARINDIYSLMNAGLPASAWEAIGAAIFFASVFMLLVSWDKAKELAPAAIPTNIKLQFNLATGHPVKLDGANIWRWYVLNMLGPNLAKKGQPPVHNTTATTLFLLYEKPATIKQILVNANPSGLPRYEVKDRSTKHLIIHFRGPIPPGTILEINGSPT